MSQVEYQCTSPPAFFSWRSSMSARELLDDLNQRPFKQMPGNRLDTFTRLEQPALRALPRHAYQYVDIKRAKVGIDYHVHYACHYYSVPHQYVGLHVEVHGSDSLVRMFYQGNEIAAHRRKRSYGFTTEAAHMPRRHAEHSSGTAQELKFSCGSALSWSAKRILNRPIECVSGYSI